VAEREIRTRVCIAGGGPAGMMLGFLLARAGIDVVVLEKHADFLRDFRGDTVHPSTLEVFKDLGLLDRLLARPHQRTERISVVLDGTEIEVADFTRLPTAAKFIAFMPQDEFLSFVRDEAAAYPSFRLRMRTPAVDLITEGGVVKGVRAEDPDGALTVRADLVVAADGRHSVLRERAGFHVQDFGAPIDVLWFRLPRIPSDPPQSLGRVRLGDAMVLLNRGDYWQCGLLIRKGAFDATKARGLDAFRAQIVAIAPFFDGRAGELASWDAVKLQTVKVDRLTTWAKPGLLCIGDAAHAMSPVGGVGINLAIQDAVAAANLLTPALREGVPDLDALQRVQARRLLPTRLTQRAQIIAHKRILDPVLGRRAPTNAAAIATWLRRLPCLKRLPALAIGVGIRPEHPL
jgi:2-polyprenyl-6-methoxyphenol hydroxylase-like FAD-dependent oxidoreductase